MGAKPALDLSPGQRKGRPVDEPVPLYRLDPTIGSTDLPGGPGERWRRRRRTRCSGPWRRSTPGAHRTSPTGWRRTRARSCHAAHDAQGPMLLREPEPQSSTCFTCHDGTGASDRRPGRLVEAHRSRPTTPRPHRWYSHPATSPSNHQSDREDEFGGTLNRHAACADCHQPHLADATRPVEQRRRVVRLGRHRRRVRRRRGERRGRHGSGLHPPDDIDLRVRALLQVPLRLHAAARTGPGAPEPLGAGQGHRAEPGQRLLPPRRGRGQEPDERHGSKPRGHVPLQALGLRDRRHGPLPELPRRQRLVATQRPQAGAPTRSLDNHAVAEPRDPDRTVQGPDSSTPAGAYLAQDFALCYVCHAEAPMVDDSGDVRTDTNFSWHGYHMNDISGNGTGGTDIDVAGAGHGNATCAECHFRTHGTALAVERPGAGQGPRELRAQRPAAATASSSSCPRPRRPWARAP